MPRKLKVFRTTAGFHDAFVAAPSRAAALRAWGATTDLFAMDAAEEVTDSKLIAEPLARPGQVIRRSRGSDHEHMAAAAGPAGKLKAKTSTAPKPKSRPSRAQLDKAEKRLARAEADRAEEEKAFEQERAALREREDAARLAFHAKLARMEAAREAQAETYDAALRRWRAN